MNAPDTTTKSRRVPKRPAAKQPAAAKSLGQGLSAAARQRAAAILEVLAGERTPQQAAAALSISLPYFYLVERKALQGLVKACEPQPKGPPAPGPERKLAALELELARCRRECQRQEALSRATQRAVGLPAPPSQPMAKVGDKKGVRRRHRRPVVRALRAAQTLRQNSSGSAPPAELQTLPTEVEASLPTSCEKEMEHVAARG
jgi:hypothetical protein